jgi:epoxyqueuosine reductase
VADVEPIAAAQRVLSLARAEGLAIAGIAEAAPIVRHADFVAWLEQGFAADMSWLARDAAPRADPRALLPEARSVLVAAISYAHAGEIVPVDHLHPRGAIARYARGADYHHELKERLRRVGNAIEQAEGRKVARLVCVDTAPLLERELAQQAGLGFIGKSAMLIAPGAGSYLNLGALLLDLELAPGTALGSRCGSCTACLTACPTGAFVGPHVIDARRCIAYLTIENRGPIPHALRRQIGTRIFGCDVCQEVCPFNAGGAVALGADVALAPRPGYSAPALIPLMRIGAAQFRKWQQRSALRRIHRAELLRNVAVALGNAGGEESLPALAEALIEPSALVRSHVAWALGEIGQRHIALRERTKSILEGRLSIEDDEEVRNEIGQALRYA